MIILGIDPGTATTGWGLIHVTDNSTLSVIKYGLIETPKDGAPANRLASINAQLCSIIDTHKPDIFVMEKLFFATNAKTAIRVGQAQGVMLMAAATANLPVYEYAPGSIKKMVSGNGRADKTMVQQAVRKVLGAGVRKQKGKKTHFDNAADALAVAICHVYTVNST